MSSNCGDALTLVLYWINPEHISAQCEWALQNVVSPTKASILEYVEAFFLTNLIELPFYFLALNGIPFLKRLFYLFVANLLTHPVVYFLLPYLFFKLNRSYGIYISVAELFAPALEIWFVSKVARKPLPQTIVLIGLANLASWTIGSFL